MTNTFDLLFGARFYDADIVALRCLGLNPDADISERAYVDLGEYVKRDEQGIYYRIRVSVIALPAMFWRFDIRPESGAGKPCILETGSGCFVDYWKTATLFAEGMLVLRNSPT